MDTYSKIAMLETSPSEVSELGVHRGSNNLTIDLAEFFNSIAEGCDLRGTNKGEIQWIEEENQIFAW